MKLGWLVLVEGVLRPLQERLSLLLLVRLLINLRTLRLSVMALGPTYLSTWTPMPPSLVMSCEASLLFDPTAVRFDHSTQLP